MSVHGQAYDFTPGDYTVEVFVKLALKSFPTKLADIHVTLDEMQAHFLRAGAGAGAGVMFELQPETDTYAGHMKEGPPLT